MTRPRDAQRSRLYRAEYPLWDVGQRWQTVPEVQAYVDRLDESAWFQRRWGRRRIVVEDGRGRRSAVGYTYEIGVPRLMRRELIVLHEIAHCLTPRTYAPHGPEFAGVVLTLVRHKMGDEAGRQLAESYRAHKVRVNMKAVPKPKRSVVTMTEERRRLAAAARRPPTLTERMDAVEVIRRAARNDVFGPSGRKLRTYALAVARALEEQS